MVTPDAALSNLPIGLRSLLLSEFKQIIKNYQERRWTTAELSGGRFCEIVYTILDGYAKRAFASAPAKPRDFVSACRSLESSSNVPRSFQILIPRLLPVLYEIRNNRNVGHVGGDVNPDFMDSSAVVSMAGWIMAELVRVFHRISTEEAQQLTDNLTERKIPLVWKSGELRRVLKPGLRLKDQILLLLGSVSDKASIEQLLTWTESKNRTHFFKILKELHDARLIEHYKASNEVELLPPGAEFVSRFMAEESKT